MREKELLKVLRSYVDRGLYLLPCRPKTKLPFNNDWKNLASNDWQKIQNWVKTYPDCNWAILPSKSGHVVVDCDMKVDDKKNTTGVEHWEKLCDEHGRPDTLTARTGSGGLHAMFKAKDGEKYSGKYDNHKSIDIRFNNYIIVYPSIHESGNQYVWENEGVIAEMPEWVETGLHAKKESKTPNNVPINGIDWKHFLDDFKEVAEELKDKDIDYLEWVKIGMSIHAMMPTDDGLDLWLIVTNGKNYVEGDDEGARYRWAGFEWGLDYGVTERTLIWLARRKGCSIPQRLEDVFDVFDIQNAHDRIEAESLLHEGWFVDGTDRKCTVHREFLIEWMNEQYTMMNHEPQNTIVSFKIDPDGVRNATTLKTEGFHLYFKNLFFKFYDYSKALPKAKYKPASEVWIESRSRSEHSRIVFRPAAEPGELNLWSEIPCNPVEGEVAAFIELCEQVFANGNKAKGKWFIQWCAHIVQFPDIKSTLVPVLIGDQGTGKGLFADGIMSRLLGPFYSRITQSAEFKEKFNKSHSKKFLTFIDEATWRGDKTEDGILKSLTGSAVMTVEEKFGARYTIENYSRYLIASNNQDAVAVERSNRRYMIFLVNNAYHQKDSFFKPFWEEIKNGDMVGRIYNYLKNVDLTDFNPFVLPHFDADATDAKLATEGVVAQFWYNLLFEDARPIWLNESYLAKDRVYAEFQEFHKEAKSWEKGISRMVFWKKSAKLIKILHGKETRARTGNGNVRVFKSGINELFRCFCSTFSIEMPEDFDDLDYLIEADFTE